MTTNGTLDTRLSQNLTKTYEIPCNIEYDRFSSFKVGGGNGIWLVHCPSGVKAYFATENNFDKKTPLNDENRGMRFAEIGAEGITKLYDNFYIFTEGKSADDKLIITISSQESAVEPILGNASGNIAKLDEVGGFSTNAINDLSRAVLGGVCPKCNTNRFQKQILITGGYEFAPNQNAQGMKLYHFPLGKDFKISSLGLRDDNLYRIRQVGHFDIGQARRDIDGTILYRAKKSNEVTYNYTSPTLSLSRNTTAACALPTGNFTDLIFNEDNSQVTFSSKGTLSITTSSTHKRLEVDNSQTFDLIWTDIDSLNEIYNTNTNRKIPDYTNIWGNGKHTTYYGAQCYDGTAYINYNCRFTGFFIKDSTTDTAAATTTTFYSIYQSAHLSLIKEIDSPSYTDAPSGVSSSFSNLLTSLTLPYYQKFDLWGQKVRHSNKNDIINNYEGTGINANSFDLVVSGATLNAYDNFMLGFNVTNLYNPDLKLTASSADCHSSMILEITEL